MQGVRCSVGTIHMNRQWGARTMCRDLLRSEDTPVGITGPTHRIAWPQLHSKYASPTRFDAEVSATVDLQHLTAARSAMRETSFRLFPCARPI